MAPKKSLFASPSSLSHHLVETSVHLKISSPLIPGSLPNRGMRSAKACCNSSPGTGPSDFRVGSGRTVLAHVLRGITLAGRSLNSPFDSIFLEDERSSPVSDGEWNPILIESSLYLICDHMCPLSILTIWHLNADFRIDSAVPSSSVNRRMGFVAAQPARPLARLPPPSLLLLRQLLLQRYA